MIPNPQLLMAAVLAVGVAGVGGYFYGRSDGAEIERAEWQARDNAALQQALEEADKLRKKVRDQERAHAEAMSALVGMYDEEMTHVEVERDAALDAVRRGERRLRDAAATARLTCDVRVSEAAASASASVQPAPADQLSRERDEAVIRLLSEADEQAAELNLCWSIVRKDREVMNGD